MGGGGAEGRIWGRWGAVEDSVGEASVVDGGVAGRPVVVEAGGCPWRQCGVLVLLLAGAEVAGLLYRVVAVGGDASASGRVESHRGGRSCPCPVGGLPLRRGCSCIE